MNLYEKYLKDEKRRKRRNFVAGMAGVIVMLGAIVIGLGEIVAPLFIIGFVLYMVIHG